MTPVELAQRFEELMRRADAPILYYELSLHHTGGHSVGVMTDRGGLERLATQYSKTISGVQVHNGFPYKGNTVTVNSLGTIQVSEGYQLRTFCLKQ